MPAASGQASCVPRLPCGSVCVPAAAAAGLKNVATGFVTEFAAAAEAYGTADRFPEFAAAARATYLYSDAASFRRGLAGLAEDELEAYAAADAASPAGTAHESTAHEIGWAVAAANSRIGRTTIWRTTASAAKTPPDSSQFLPGPTSSVPCSAPANLQQTSHKHRYCH